ncbi:DUF1566 domain-containing protein [bacterium]|nr:DUF1566 domain-containing protein [bacterium]
MDFHTSKSGFSPFQAEPAHQKGAIEMKRLFAIFTFAVLLCVVMEIVASSEELKKSKIWRDPTTGLTWETNRNVGNWLKAGSYCDNLELGGYSDWRLPNIDELRSLIRNCDNTRRGGKCNVNVVCLKVKGCYDEDKCACDNPGNDSSHGVKELFGDSALGNGDLYFIWSSSKLSDPDRPREAWTIGFYWGNLVPFGVDLDESIGWRCVR